MMVDFGTRHERKELHNDFEKSANELIEKTPSCKNEDEFASII